MNEHQTEGSIMVTTTSEHARLLQVLAESGRGIETVIPDPVAWQQEMRSARDTMLQTGDVGLVASEDHDVWVHGLTFRV